MRRIAIWLIAGLVLIRLALPKVAYACTPTPIYWKLTVSEMWLYASDLPDGFAISDSSGKSFLFTNDTDEFARLAIPHWRTKTIAPNTTLTLTKLDLYPALFPSQRHGDDGVYFDPYEEGTSVTTVPLMDEIEMILKYEGQEYSILARFYYDIEYVSSDNGASCQWGMLVFAIVSWIAPPALGIVIVIALVVFTVKHLRANRRAAP